MPEQGWTCKTCKAKYPAKNSRQTFLNAVLAKRSHPGKPCSAT